MLFSAFLAISAVKSWFPLDFKKILSPTTRTGTHRTGRLSLSTSCPEPKVCTDWCSRIEALPVGRISVRAGLFTPLLLKCLMCLSVNAQGSRKVTLVIFTLRLEPFHDLRLNFHRYFYLLFWHSPFCGSEKFFGKGWSFRSINHFIGHGIKTFQIRLCRLAHRFYMDVVRISKFAKSMIAPTCIRKSTPIILSIS